MVNGLCIYGGKDMELKEKIIDDLQDIFESMAYKIAAYRYPNRYSYEEDVENILKEYKVDKILKEVKRL